METSNLHKDVSQTLELYLQSLPNVVAAWEGGAVANGFADQYSDLDLLIVISDDQVEPIFIGLEALLAGKYGISRKFRMPEPAWHGMSQCFYLLDKQEDFVYCDIAILNQDKSEKFTEPDRHGHARIWFDKVNIYKADPSSQQTITTMGKRIYKMVTDTDFLSLLELEKAITRKNFLASHMNYTIFLNRHLIPLMNLKFRPAKADFGIRYADREYPETEARMLEQLLKNSSFADIISNYNHAKAMYQELKQELGNTCS